MALRKIVEMGDECLNKVCRPVTEFNSRLHDLLDDMGGDPGGRQRRGPGGAAGRCPPPGLHCDGRDHRGVSGIGQP